MDLPERLHVIHQPARLRIMALLNAHGDIGFTEAQKHLGLTAGNMDAHIRRLSVEGLVTSRRALAADRFEVRIAITRRGQAAFTHYLQALRGFLVAAEDGASARQKVAT